MRTYRYVCCVVLLGLPVTVFSEQWSFEPVASLAVEYNDNTQLTPIDSAKIDSTAFALDLNARFIRRGQRSEIRIAPRIRSRDHAESVLDDTNDLFLEFAAFREFERTRLGVFSRAAREDIGTAEIEDPDFDNPDVENPVDLDTGRIRIGIDRDIIIASPYFDHDWTETVGIRTALNYVDVSYDQNQLNLTDYSNTTLSTGLSFQVSDRTRWLFSVYGSDYESEVLSNRSESQSIGADLKFLHKFSERTEGQISVGYEDVDTDFFTSGGSTVSTSSGVTVFAAGITRRGDISRLVVEARQSVDPGGSGFVQERTQFRLRYTRQLSPRIYGNVNARIQTTEEVSADPVLNPGRDYQRVELGLEWRLTRIWSVRGDYIFSDQEFESTVGNATSNEFVLRLVYDPARRAR